MSLRQNDKLSLSMTNVVWFHTGHLHLRLVCFLWQISWNSAW